MAERDHKRSHDRDVKEKLKERAGSHGELEFFGMDEGVDQIKQKPDGHRTADAEIVEHGKALTQVPKTRRVWPNPSFGARKSGSGFGSQKKCQMACKPGSVLTVSRDG